MKYINRFLMIFFSLLLLIGIFNREFLVFAALLAIPLGLFQSLSCLTELLKWRELNKEEKTFVLSYLTLLAFYFIFWRYSLGNSSKIDFLKEVIFLGLPVVLAFSFTFYLEKLKLEE